MKKLLPIGIQTFKKLRQEGFLYVDKTRYIYKLITQGSVYFFARPRRFGKSLLISTLKEIFVGNKDLFQGLYIYQTNYQWHEYPVIRIDFSGMDKDNPELLKKDLILTLDIISQAYNIKFDIVFNNPATYLKFLIQKLSNINKVVILIDEYDAPLVKQINNPEIFKENREFLKEFYAVIKAQDEYIRFVLLTGVSKFSKVGVFSGLNNLEDITMDGTYNSLLGLTQEEVETNFNDYLKEFRENAQTTSENLLLKIKHWYNGYRFSEKEEYVYNPFSTLLLFKQQKFRYHWFESGTPSFLINLIKEQNYNIEKLDNLEIGAAGFSSYEIENLTPLSLLFQTGYLTIKDYNPEFGIYKLAYPNFEVKSAFLDRLTQSYTKLESGLSESYIVKLSKALVDNNLKEFFDKLRVFFANIPYDLQLKHEKYYQTIFYLIFSLIGLKTKAEVKTNHGRIDAVIELRDTMYIFEFKLYDSKEDALSQIKEKKYYEKFLNKNKDIYLVGVEFDKCKKNIGEYISELVNV